MNDAIARYLDCWNETDPGARRKLIDDAWAADASYIDPLAEAHGRDAIDGVIAAAQAQFPGFVFTLASPVDVHHRQARFSWGLGPAGAEPLVVGFDVAVTNEVGQLTTVLGFLDKVPG
jgi:SnoaL-like domain